MKSKKKKTKGERRKILHQNLVAYSFLAPSLIGVICFSLIPLIFNKATWIFLIVTLLAMPPFGKIRGIEVLSNVML